MVQRLLLGKIDAASVSGRHTHARGIYRTCYPDHAIQWHHVELLRQLWPVPTIDGDHAPRWYSANRGRCHANRRLRHPMVAHPCYLLPTCHPVRSQLRNHRYLVATLHVIPIPSPTRSVDSTRTHKFQLLCRQSLPSDQCARLLPDRFVRQCPCGCVVPSCSTTSHEWHSCRRKCSRPSECSLCRKHRIELRTRIDAASPHHELWDELWGELRFLSGNRYPRQQLPSTRSWLRQPGFC